MSTQLQDMLAFRSAQASSKSQVIQADHADVVVNDVQSSFKAVNVVCLLLMSLAMLIDMVVTQQVGGALETQF